MPIKLYPLNKSDTFTGVISLCRNIKVKATVTSRHVSHAVYPPPPYTHTHKATTTKKNGKCFWRWITRSWVIILIFSIVLQLVKKKSCLTREINSIFNVKPLNALYYSLNKSDIFRGRYIQTVKISKLLFLQCENTCTKRLLHVLHAMHCMECFRFLKKVYWFNLTHETWFKKKYFTRPSHSL